MLKVSEEIRKGVGRCHVVEDAYDGESGLAIMFSE